MNKSPSLTTIRVRPHHTRLVRASRRRRRLSRVRIGAALVEFAMVAPLMILFTLGMIEIGRMTMVKQILVNISREGSRLATLPNSTNQMVQSNVQTLLSGSGIQGATVSVSPSSIATAPSGSMVSVSITVPAQNVSWLSTPLFMAGKNVQAATSMRKESL